MLKSKPRKKMPRALFAACLLLDFFFILEDEGDMFIETLIDFQWAIQSYTPEDKALDSHCCGTLISNRQQSNLLEHSAS
jgi:hypothetical protein